MFREHINVADETIAELCQRRSIRKLWLFGSVLRDDFRPDSDVDVLVEFEPEARITLLDLVTIEHELEDLFQRNVDLGTPTSLSKFIRKRVLDTAQVLYERP